MITNFVSSLFFRLRFNFFFIIVIPLRGPLLWFVFVVVVVVVAGWLTLALRRYVFSADQT